ncbi:MAG: GTP-binding protein [Burkholderiaceae bacterium]
MPERIPVTVLAGYLGAGKTTLLNRILSEDHGRRYAVIVNEFGEIGIDADLIISADEELFEMNNGCVCCTVRGDLIRTLHGLLHRHRLDGALFDAILVEASGLADPGPVAQTFFVDTFLQARTRLDSVITLVDARHIVQRLADSREAAEQIGFADQIILNKIDLATEEELRGIEARLRRLNPLAALHRARRADVALEAVLGRGGFDLERIETLAEPDHRHDEDCGPHAVHDPAHGHAHDASIVSVSLSSAAPMESGAIFRWLEGVLAAQGQDILRAKGIVHVQGQERRLVFQAVHRLLEGDLQRPWKAQESRSSRLVFIGRNLDAAALKLGFDACAACA